MNDLLLCFFLLSLLVSDAYAQQNYSGNSALDCSATDETGTSPAFLYTCNGQERTCQAFLVFKSQPFYDSVPTIAALMSSDQEELARINNVTKLSEFPHNKEVIVPVTCSCYGQYYQANTTFHVTRKSGTYYTIAGTTYEGLSTCASLIRANSYPENQLKIDAQLQVPLRCACLTLNQTLTDAKYLLTYPVSLDDRLPRIAERFNVSLNSILEANGLKDNATPDPDTTILIPLPAQPKSSQTIIHNNPPKTSSPPASAKRTPRSKRRLYEYASLIAACFLLILAVSLATVFVLCKKKRNNFMRFHSEKKRTLPEDLRVEIESFEQVLQVYEIEQVKKATKDFSEKQRIKGSVYRGEFSGEILAVKKMMNGDVSEEVKILRRINHINLIKLLGFCEGCGCFYLVFEYMKNESLREWLSSSRTLESDGNLAKRVQIAVDIANGLHYLHSFTKPAYIHKDIRSSNILLNADMRAKIANFSLARAATMETADLRLTNRVVGTRGYMAPEYIEAGQVTSKIDVYAFGVVLLELITGKEAVFIHNGKELLLSTTILSIMEKENAVPELESFIDPGIRGSHRTEIALRLALVSAACLTKEPTKRPSMEEVASSLLKIQADLHKLELPDVVPVDEAVPMWSPLIGETDWMEESI